MTSETLFVTTALNSWKQIIAQIDKGLAASSDEDLQREVAPGKNRVYYLLGHLTAVHDLMLPLLRVGDRLYPELDEEFLTKPDRTFPESRTNAAELRKAWSAVNENSTQRLRSSVRSNGWKDTILFPRKISPKNPIEIGCPCC